MPEVKFVDTTIRDGQGSLWATSMRTRHMVPVMPLLDSAGFDSMEFLAAGSRLKKFVRHLKENPWDWIKSGVALAERTPLRWHGPIDGARMSGVIPPEVGELLIEKVVDLGIRLNRTGNNWNNYEVVGRQLKRFDRLGMTCVVNIIYSVSPRHTDEYFIEKTREAASLAPYRLCLKDVGGLLTPEVVRRLVPQMIEVAGDIEWEFHGHCNNGLGPVNAIEAAKAGIKYIHTAVPPLANGNSQPSVYNVASNLRELGYEVPVDLARLYPVTSRLGEIAEREGFPIGSPNEFDLRVYRHQIPGGMASNLKYQLEQAGQADRLDEVLEETERVRAEFGYPIMVTPLSQFVGSQSAINVITGERYGQVTDRTIEYSLGWHGGQEAIDAMDVDVRAKILDRPRTAQIRELSRELPTLKQLREKYGRDVCDEDLILCAIVGDDATRVVGSALEKRDHSEYGSVADLMQELLKFPDRRALLVERGDLRIRVG